MPDTRSAFREFERSGCERAAPRYAECWTGSDPPTSPTTVLTASFDGD